MGSPVLKPGGHVSVRTPQRCAIGLDGIAKFEIHTLSSPSTTTAHGPGRLRPENGAPAYGVPSGRSRLTLPPLPGAPVCLLMARVSTGSGLSPLFIVL